MVPWRACLWLRRNLGSVPLSEGYLWVFGFLMLCAQFALASRISCVVRLSSLQACPVGAVVRYRMAMVGEVVRTRSCEPSCSGCAANCSLTLREN